MASRKRQNWVVLVLVFTSLCVTSCATSMGKNEKTGTYTGAVVGTILGAILGKYIGGKRGVAAGIIIGGVIGGYLGNRIGSSFDERNRRLAEIQKKTGIDIHQATYSTLDSKNKDAFEARLKHMDAKSRQKAYQSKVIYKIVVPSQFASGSARLSSRTKSFFYDVIRAYKADGVRKVMIVGHADSSGRARSNQRLSELRARAVAREFMRAGYPASLIYYQGAGESEPVADNATPQGRAKNRRVEIVDANSTHDLALAKRISIVESRARLQKVERGKADKQKKVQNSVVHPVVAVNIPGSDSILPFHGEPYRGQQLVISGRKASETGKSASGGIAGIVISSMIGTAYASETELIPAFPDDDMAIAGAIKRLDGKAKNLYTTDDYLHGYYRQPVYTYLSGDAFFYLRPVSVLQDEILANQKPEMAAYKRYDGKGDKPDVRLHGTARLYVSGDRMLYRWKAGKSAAKRTGIIGMDIVLPIFNKTAFNKTHTQSLDALVYYLKKSKLYVSKIRLKIKLYKESNIKWRV